MSLRPGCESAPARVDEGGLEENEGELIPSPLSQLPGNLECQESAKRVSEEDQLPAKTGGVQLCDIDCCLIRDAQVTMRPDVHAIQLQPPDRKIFRHLLEQRLKVR